MKVAEFLKRISDEQGPLQTTAADLMERMGRGDFNELIGDMRHLSARTWKERHEASEWHGAAENAESYYNPLLGRGGEFHPTNKNHD